MTEINEKVQNSISTQIIQMWAWSLTMWFFWRLAKYRVVKTSDEFLSTKYFKFYGAKLWNNINTNIVNLPSLNIFKRNYKKYLLLHPHYNGH